MPKQKKNPRPPGERFGYWLAQAATEAREAAGVSPNRIADLAGIESDVTIKRFERGAAHWPNDLDTLMAAYAHAADLQDTRELFQRAVTLWFQHGTAPRLQPGPHDAPDQRFVEAVRSAQAPRGSRPAPARKPNASEKKRASC